MACGPRSEPAIRDSRSLTRDRLECKTPSRYAVSQSALNFRQWDLFRELATKRKCLILENKLLLSDKIKRIPLLPCIQSNPTFIVAWAAIKQVVGSRYVSMLNCPMHSGNNSTSRATATYTYEAIAFTLHTALELLFSPHDFYHSLTLCFKRLPSSLRCFAYRLFAILQTATAPEK